jgi:hypothetical protein
MNEQPKSLRHENPYLKMQALMPTPRQREFGIGLVIFCFVPPDMNHTVLTIRWGRSPSGTSDLAREMTSGWPRPLLGCSAARAALAAWRPGPFRDRTSSTGRSTGPATPTTAPAVIFCFVPPDMNHTVLTGSNWWWKVDGRRLASNRNDGIVFRPLSSKFKAKLEYQPRPSLILQQKLYRRVMCVWLG